MRMFPEKYRLPIWISILLIAGFLSTGIAGFMVSRDTVQRGITENALPLAGDSVYADIQADIQRPAVIASMMASDSFVRDWLLAGENDSTQIVRYLDEIKREYGAVTSFLVSDRSRNYYYADGTLKRIDENDPRDGWFFRARTASARFVSDIDVDPDGRKPPTVFVNYRMLDRDGSFLGIAGIGLRMDALAARIRSHEERYGRRIYFIDAKGAVVLAGASKPQSAAAADVIAAMRNGNRTARFAYGQGDARSFVDARYVPELGWYLVVEQNAVAALRPVKIVLAISLAIGAAVTLLAFALALGTVKRYQKRLELVAGTDPLTGVLNRQAFEIVFRQSALEAARSGRPLSGILFNIDFFRQVNDSHGYLAGDNVLRTIAQLVKTMVRDSDIVTRWGGEEFAILLNECALEQAVAVAEKLRSAIDHHDFSAIAPEHHITISVGVAQYAEQESAAVFFARADEALFKAKMNGRNRLQVARGALADQVLPA
jgi:diguanylate cyclase (GGDEF)-like protein